MSSVVGQASAAATSVAIPAHAVGDLIIVSARGTAAAPSVPAAGGTVPAWTTLQSGLANSIGLTTVAFVATATNHTTGAFTNATHICVLVLRPTAGQKLQTAAARSSTGNANNTQTIVYPALTLIDTDGSSMGVRIGTRVTADSEVGTNVPAGWTNQSIQPAGASALMAVHTRLGLTSNPTADSIATTGTNAAYRAHTIEIEEVPVITPLDASVVGKGLLDAQITPFRNTAVTIARAAAVSVGMTVVPPPITFAIDLQTNQPYAGEWEAGEFLAGMENVLAVDLQIVLIDFLDGLIAGQAQVAASLTVTKDLAVTVVGQAAVAAQTARALGLAASIDRAAAVVAQANEVRGLAAVISRAAAVSADLVRVPVTVTFGCVVSGAAVVAPSLTVTNASYVGFDTFVAGAGQVGVQATEQESLVAPIVGKATVAPDLTVATASFITFSAGISGAAAISADRSTTVTFAAPIVRAATVISVTPTVIRLVLFEARIQTIIPLCGENLCNVLAIGGPFICGGFSGPHSVITIGTTRTLSWEVPVHGQAEIEALLRPSLPFAAAIQGQAQAQAQSVLTLALAAAVQGQADVFARLNQLLNLPILIQGQAQVRAKLTYDWLGPTSPGDILLPPTQEVPWVLVPTADGSVTLVPSEEEDVVLAATEEEDSLLVPTTERSM